MPELVSFSTLASLMEGRELRRMQQNDWNANVSLQFDYQSCCRDDSSSGDGGIGYGSSSSSSSEVQ